MMPGVSFLLALLGWVLFLASDFALGEHLPGLGYREALVQGEPVGAGMVLVFLMFQGALVTGIIGLVQRRLGSISGVLLASLWLFPAAYLYVLGIAEYHPPLPGLNP